MSNHFAVTKHRSLDRWLCASWFIRFSKKLFGIGFDRLCLASDFFLLLSSCNVNEYPPRSALTSKWKRMSTEREHIEHTNRQKKLTVSSTATRLMAYIIYTYLIVYLELFKWFILFITGGRTTIKWRAPTWWAIWKWTIRLCVCFHAGERQRKNRVIYEDELTNKQTKKSTIRAACDRINRKAYECVIVIVVSVVKLNTKNFCAIAFMNRVIRFGVLIILWLRAHLFAHRVCYLHWFDGEACENCR